MLNGSCGKAPAIGEEADLSGQCRYSTTRACFPAVTRRVHVRGCLFPSAQETRTTTSMLSMTSFASSGTLILEKQRTKTEIKREQSCSCLSFLGILTKTAVWKC